MVKKQKDVQYYEAIGRRKEAIARVRLHIATAKDGAVTVKDSTLKKGTILVNNMPFEDYFTLLSQRNLILNPLEKSGTLDRFVVTITVQGGGKDGQVTAIVLGISRALCLVDETFRSFLKPEGLLTRDPRVRERRKVGMGGKARRKRQSPKR